MWSLATKGWNQTLPCSCDPEQVASPLLPPGFTFKSCCQVGQARKGQNWELIWLWRRRVFATLWISPSIKSSYSFSMLDGLQRRLTLIILLETSQSPVAPLVHIPPLLVIISGAASVLLLQILVWPQKSLPRSFFPGRVLSHLWVKQKEKETVYVMVWLHRCLKLIFSPITTFSDS